MVEIRARTSVVIPQHRPLSFYTKLEVPNNCKIKFLFHKILEWSLDVAINEWLGKISTEIDKSCHHWGPQLVESVEHRFFNYPLAQQGWRYAANIMWQLLAKRGNLGLRKSFSMMQCLFDQPLCKAQTWFHRIQLFLRSDLLWIIWHQWNVAVELSNVADIFELLKFHEVYNQWHEYRFSFNEYTSYLMFFNGKDHIIWF